MIVLVTRSFVLLFLTYIELRHGSLCPRVRACVTKPPAATADQLQHFSIYSTRDSLLGLTSTLETTLTPPPGQTKVLHNQDIDHPAVSNNDDDHQLSLPTTTTTSWLHQQRRLPAESTNIDDHQLSPPSTTTSSIISTISIVYNRYCYMDALHGR